MKKVMCLSILCILCIFSILSSCSDDYDEKDFFGDTLDLECRRMVECVDVEKRQALSDESSLDYTSLEACKKSADIIEKNTNPSCGSGTFSEGRASDCLECGENIPCDTFNIDYFRSCKETCSNVCK